MNFSARAFAAVIAALCLCPVAGENGEAERSGRFSVLTYNVAGLPEPLSGSRPIVNSSQISPGLNNFDVVVVQEDFAYHRKLARHAEHPFVSTTDRDSTLGDGLARFSIFPFSRVEHVNWEACVGYLGHASDCMTKKGFARAVHRVAPGVEIEVYNLHMEAGSHDTDTAAKEVNTDQLISFIMEHSQGRAIIVAGDFNLKKRRPRDRAMLEKIQKRLSLTDACVATGDCQDRIDRILYRSGEDVELRAAEYKVEDKMFRDRKGRPLSDHLAVSAVIEWKSSSPAHFTK